MFLEHRVIYRTYANRDLIPINRDDRYVFFHSRIRSVCDDLSHRLSAAYRSSLLFSEKCDEIAALLTSVKYHNNLPSHFDLRHQTESNICPLIVFCMYLEVCFRMLAYRAHLRSLCSHNDVTAVAALPDFDLALFEYFL